MSPETETPPRRISREEHGISRQQIDPDTLKVLYRLHRNGFKAYLVGGSVRDLLLGRTPKDFDVGTDATPDQVKKLFRNCWLVGRRFRLAHIRFGKDKVIEVATFRRHPKPEELPDDPDDHFHFVQNVFGDPREDAFRRDFTINALFYDISDFSVLDYVGGLEDLEQKRLRVIGDPQIRFTEDPVRMLRALEFAARLDFSLEESAEKAIREKASLLLEAARARVRDEILELFRHHVAGKVFQACQETGLLPFLIPDYELDEPTLALLERYDNLTRNGRPTHEYDILVLLYLTGFLASCPPARETAIMEAVHASSHSVSPHTRHFSMAAGIRAQARDLLIGLWRLLRGRGIRGEGRFLRNPGTKQAIELLALWSEACDDHKDLLANWQEALEETGQSKSKGGPNRRRRRRRRGPRREAPPSVPN